MRHVLIRFQQSPLFQSTPDAASGCGDDRRSEPRFPRLRIPAIMAEPAKPTRKVDRSGGSGRAATKTNPLAPEIEKTPPSVGNGPELSKFTASGPTPVMPL